MRWTGIATGVLLVVSIVTTCAAEQCGVAPVTRRVRRIIRGDDVTPHQYPWVVSVQHEGDHFCGGVIISEEYVITAAHCISDPEVTVVAGLHGLSSDGARVDGTATVHPAFLTGNESLVSNDIALIRLHRPLRFDEHVQPICLPSETDAGVSVGDEVHLAGWGREFSFREILLWGNSNLSSLSADQRNELLSVFYPRVPTTKILKQKKFRVEKLGNCIIDVARYVLKQRERCEAGNISVEWCAIVGAHLNVVLSADVLSMLEEELRLMENRTLGSDRVCTLAHDQAGNRSAACNGDSGSPVMRQLPDGTWSLVGIAASTPPDCITDEESILHIGVMFTDVRYHLNWIRSTMTAHSSATSAPPSQPPARDSQRDDAGQSNALADVLKTNPKKPFFTATLSWDFLADTVGPGVALNLRLLFQ